MPYNTSAIRQLLIAAFTDEEITHLCYDNFRPVHDKFASGIDFSQKVQFLIEYCEKHDQLDTLLELVRQKNPKQYCKFARKVNQERYYNLFGGEEILCLLWGLDSVELVEDVKDYYQQAYDQRINNRETAIELCQKALLMIQDPSEQALGNPNLKYARGKLYLLIAAIYLSQTECKSAEDNFGYSQREFHFWQWSHVESLAYLGLAMARRKLNKFKNALEACKKAHDCACHESIPRGIDTKELLEAIRHERATILQLRADLQPQKDEDIPHGSTEELTPSIPHPEKPPQVDEKTEAIEEAIPSIPCAEKPLQTEERAKVAIEQQGVELPIFQVSASRGLVTTRKAIDLNLLVREDYEQNSSQKPRNVVLKRKSYLNRASYILEIDEGVTPNDGLERGDWLIIREEDDLDKLNGKKVTVLLEQENETSIHLRTCVKAEDHYLLKALSKDAVSFVVINYNVSLKRMKDINVLYYDKKIIRRIDDIQVSGPILRNKRVPKESIESRVDSFVWEIPVVKSIAAGLEQPIAEKNIVDYVNVELNESESRIGNYFVVLVEGNSMKGNGIFDGDAVLIHQQENVDKGDIAAVMVVPGGNAFLKRYHLVFEEHNNARHWRLESSNPASEHLVVIPKGANIKGIHDYYDKQKQTGKIKNPIEYYEGAGVRIAGKFIKRVKLPKNFERS